MKKSILLPGLSLLFGGASFGLRLWQRSVAVDPETLLYIPSSPATFLLMFTIFAYALLLGGILFSGARKLPNFRYAFYCPNQLYASFMCAGGMLLLLSVALGLQECYKAFQLQRELQYQGVEVSGFPVSIALLLTLICSLPAGLAQVKMGKDCYRGAPMESRSMTTFPAFCTIPYLITVYQSNIASPNMQDRIYPVLGAVFMTMGHYYISETAYLDPRAKRVVFFGLMAVVVNGAALGESPTMYRFAFIVANLLCLLAQCSAVLENGYVSREKYRTPPGAEEFLEDEDQEDEDQEEEN